MPAFGADIEHAGIGKRAQLQGHRPERDIAQGLVDVAGGPFVTPDQSQDLPPPRGCNGGQDGSGHGFHLTIILV